MALHDVEEYLRRRPEEIRPLFKASAIAAAARRVGFALDAAGVEAAFQQRSKFAVLARGRGWANRIPAAPSLRDPEKWQAIAAMDLRPIEEQMVSSYGWEPARASAVTELYRRFFYLMATVRPGEHCAPTEEIDEVWHRHILNTRRYAADCEAHAGRFVHHEPSSKTGAEAAAVLRAVAQTAIRWETEFGTPYPPEETLGAALLDRPAPPEHFEEVIDPAA